MQNEALPQAEADENREGCEHDSEESDGAAAYGTGSAQIPEGAAEDDGESPQRAAVAGGPVRRDSAEIEDEGDGVDGHVEDAGGEGEPGFLKSPEGAQRAAHPDIVTTLFGNRGGKFTHHEGSRERPDKWDEEQEEKGSAVAGFADDVFQAVRAAGDHKVRGSNEG